MSTWLSNMSPASSLFITFISVPMVLVLLTRLLIISITAIRGHTQNDVGPRQPIPISYWIPWIGQGISYGRPRFGSLQQIFSNTRLSIFTVYGWGHCYHVIVSPHLRDEVLQKSSTHLNDSELLFSLLKEFLGDRGKTAILAKSSDTRYWTKYCALSNSLNNTSFITSAVKSVSRALEGQTWNLVSGNDSWVDQEMWERNAHVRLRPDDQIAEGQDFVAEADLHALLCEWVGHIVATQLMGRAFVQANPTIVDDILMMDSKKTSFASKLPTLLMPGLVPALYARERLIKAITELFEAMVKTMNDQDPGTTYDDLSDVPELIWDQVRLHRDSGADPRTAAVASLLIFWSVIMDSTQLVFWTIFYLYSNKELLERVRKEIHPHIRLQEPEATGLAITESPRLQIDTGKLLSNSTNLSGALYEVLRLETTPYIYKCVTSDFVINESPQDARVHGRTNPISYIVRKGDRLLVPGRLHQFDANYFPNPEYFHPKRFHAGSDDVSSPQPNIQSDTMRPWDRGDNIFTCGTVVEKEVLLFAAAFVTVWDIEPMDKSLFNPFRGWQHPGRVLNIGVSRPKRDMRVKIWHRKRGQQ